jgi:hypothetical protein
MEGWDALSTVLTALPDHALLRSGAMAARKGEEPMMEGSVMGEGGFDPTSALASLLTLSFCMTGAAPLAYPWQKVFESLRPDTLQSSV